MHDSGQTRSTKFTNQPVQPVKIQWAAAPVRNPDIDMMRQAYPFVNGGIHYLGRIKAVWLLPHQQQTALRRLFKLKTVRKVEVRVEQHQLCAWITEQQWIGNLAPARMTAAEGAKVIVACKYCRLAIAEVFFRIDRPLMCTYVNDTYSLGQFFLILLRIGDEPQLNRFKRIAKQAF